MAQFVLDLFPDFVSDFGLIGCAVSVLLVVAVVCLVAAALTPRCR